MHHCAAHPTDGANPPTAYPSVYLAEVMAFICVVASALSFKQGHHLPPASIPVKHSSPQLLARLEDKLGHNTNQI